MQWQACRKVCGGTKRDIHLEEISEAGRTNRRGVTENESAAKNTYHHAPENPKRIVMPMDPVVAEQNGLSVIITKLPVESSRAEHATVDRVQYRARFLD